jgi:hypothetical protein
VSGARGPRWRSGVMATSAAALLGGCIAVSADEREELAVWDGCIEAAIAEYRDPQGQFLIDGRTVFFEVTYKCRALFPDLDQGGKTRTGQKLLNRLYSRIAYRGPPTSQENAQTNAQD